MKSAQDPRHEKRRKIIKELFANSFFSQSASLATKDILKNSKQIDQLIQNAAPQWPLARLNKIDLAVLRLAIYEINKNTAPVKVIIDEAVELSKEYGGESSPSFINGVLGTILKNQDAKQSN